MEGAALAIVPLLLDAGRPVRANLSLDAGLLDASMRRQRHMGSRVGLARRAQEREKIEGGGITSFQRFAQ